MSDSSTSDETLIQSRGRSWKLLIWIIVAGLSLAVSLVVVVRYGVLPLYYALLLVAFVSYFPLSYVAYLQFRAEIHRERVKDDFRLLGLFQKEDKDAELEALYRPIYSQQQFVIYVLLAALTTLLGFGLFYFRGGLSFVSETVILTVFYSFLGSYVFSIYYVYRRYSTLDLQPGVYLYATVRMITVQAIALVAAQQLQTGTEGMQRLVPVVAFVIGYLPDTGVRWLTATAERVVGKLIRRNERLLSNIDGISLWHETRLRESGIDNVQNLATVNVRELLLSSRFSAEQLMHWIDQSILIVNLPDEKFKALREYGIRTISAFRLLWKSIEPDELPKVEEITKEELRALYYAAETGPNLHYVIKYWEAVKTYRTESVERGLAQVLGVQFQEQAEKVGRALADVPIERLSDAMLNLAVSPQTLESLFLDAPALVGLGRVYTQRQLYEDAVRVLTQAIGADSQSAAAYSNRGLAYAMLDKFDRAFDDFVRAEQLDPGYAVTFNHKGVAYIRQASYHQAISSLSHAIKLDLTYAQAYYNRGYARRRLVQLDEAVNDFGRALEHDSKLYLAYIERGLTHLRRVAYVKAIRDFDAAIQINRTNAQAYSSRGAAYMGLSDYRRAIYDLDTAVELDPTLTVAHFNRGQARLKLGDVVGAIDDLGRALKLDSTFALAYRERALAHIKLDAFSEATADFVHYLDLQPDATDAGSIREQIEQLRQHMSTEKLSPTGDSDQVAAAS